MLVTKLILGPIINLYYLSINLGELEHVSLVFFLPVTIYAFLHTLRSAPYKACADDGQHITATSSLVY